MAYYDREMADLSLFFEMREIRKLLISVEGEQLPATGLASAHQEVLAAAAMVYRKYWWPAHDRANRAWIADTMSKVVSLSPAVPDRLARLYGTPWFSWIMRVDVVRVGGRQGAYTSNDPAPGHITISSSDSAIQGWMAAEVFASRSFSLTGSTDHPGFRPRIAGQGKNSRDLWHVSLFYLTGEVVRQAFARRGIPYEPYIYKTGLFDRAWPQYKAPIETHWKAYINGELARDAAIKNVVTAIK